ncbi:hypothetical protein RJT34_32474 [Clitoria ternatea]|uniref:Uncharacterized protein n=1 Tax=Clitoria ternatea TaxID=43366 RepID=A0AAN9EX15_CLITE
MAEIKKNGPKPKRAQMEFGNMSLLYSHFLQKKTKRKNLGGSNEIGSGNSKLVHKNPKTVENVGFTLICNQIRTKAIDSSSLSSKMEVQLPTLSVPSLLHAVLADTLLSAAQSITLIGYLLTNVTNSVSPNLTSMGGRFPLEDLYGRKHAYLENKSETEDDDDGEDDDEDGHDEDDDGEDDEYSGDEGDEEGDPEDDPEANGAGGSDDGDEDDDDDGDEEDDEDVEDEEEEEEEDEEESPQPPAKKRK